MSAFEADRFNHSRTSPESSCTVSGQLSATGRFLASLGRTIPARGPVRPTTGRSRLRLTTVSKERLQHLGAAPSQNSAANLDLMVHLRMIQDLHHRMHRASFGVAGSVYQAADASMYQGAGAHRARLNCSKQFTLFQTVVTNGDTGFAQRYDLGVGCGIAVDDVAIPSASHDLALAHPHRAHRDFSRLKSALRAAQGLLHPDLVGSGLGRYVLALVAVSCGFRRGHSGNAPLRILTGLTQE